MQVEKIESDVLCVGGGICGLMAAIRASEVGANVVIAEKSNTLRSGSGATGNDHFSCYIPEVHGIDFKSFMEERRRSEVRRESSSDPEIQRVWMEKAFDIVQLWESWGIPMKYHGGYEFAGHALPGRLMTALKYAGQMQKPILTKEALKRGARILNRLMILDLVVNDGVIGAIGIHTRENKLIMFQAKSVILGTGTVSRLYPSLTPGWVFNAQRPASLCGDGRAMAFRAGAELYNMEMPYHHPSTKYFAKSGQATWVGVLKDPQGIPIGPFAKTPDKKYGDMMMEINPTIFLDYAKAGKGPVYMDCTGISDDDYEYMMHWLQHEGLSAIIDHLKGEGIDLKKNPVEFTTYMFRGSGGLIRRNAKSETTLKGLYAAGDETGGSISAAATFGWIAGENAAKYAEGVSSTDIGKAAKQIERLEELIKDIRSRKVGPEWEEVNIALQQTMYDYAGTIRSEALLDAGLRHLRRLKEKALTTMIARDQHELVRGLETLNLLELGELVFIAANERKETRGLHVRADYPYSNPIMNTALVIKKRNEKTITEWK